MGLGCGSSLLRGGLLAGGWCAADRDEVGVRLFEAAAEVVGVLDGCGVDEDPDVEAAVVGDGRHVERR